MPEMTDVIDVEGSARLEWNRPPFPESAPDDDVVRLMAAFGDARDKLLAAGRALAAAGLAVIADTDLRESGDALAAVGLKVLGDVDEQTIEEIRAAARALEADA